MGISDMTHAKDEKGWLVVTEEVYVKSVGQRRKARPLPQYERQQKLSCPTETTWQYAANKNKVNA